MADVQDLDDIIELVSVGEDAPPTAFGSRGAAHITGAAPTGKWEGNPNALAIDNGDGSFRFVDAVEMKKPLYFWEDGHHTWDGSALVALGGGGGEAPEPPEPELPAAPTTDGAYTLKSTVTGGVSTLSWVADAPAGMSATGSSDRDKRAAGPGAGGTVGGTPPSGSVGPKGPSGGAGGGRLGGR